jgi:ferredoxin
MDLPSNERESMADIAYKYAENVSGNFYVDDRCIDCDLCRETAPANFTRSVRRRLGWINVKPGKPRFEMLDNWDRGVFGRGRLAARGSPARCACRA